MDSLKLGAVSVQYDDYMGTAAADDADAMAVSRSLYQMVGLDRDEWLIVSVELAHTKHSERVSVYAVDRSKHQVVTMADVEDLAESQGELPVVAFDLPESVSVAEFVAEAFQRFSVRLVSRSLQSQTLDVVGRQRLAVASG